MEILYGNEVRLSSSAIYLNIGLLFIMNCDWVKNWENYLNLKNISGESEIVVKFCTSAKDRTLNESAAVHELRE